MQYKAWSKIDSGREGLWKIRVWLGALHIIARHEGENVYDSNAAVYLELEEKLPGVGWMKQENGAPRPLFRDYAKPWTATGVLDLTDQKFRLTQKGKNIVEGKLNMNDFFRDFTKDWTEDGERPFIEIASAFIKFSQPLSLRDLYFGVMLGYRRGDDIFECITTSRSIENSMEDTPRRRLLMLLHILEMSGAIAREDLKSNETDTKWIVWDSKFIQLLASIDTQADEASSASAVSSFNEICKPFLADAKASGLSIETSFMRRFVSSLTTKRFLVLTGLSGSGKTKVAEAFAGWICDYPTSNLQSKVIAVGADWTSNENLLGYADALKENNYRLPIGGSLELFLRAADDPTKPYFLILDEMNLSHVERYFADFLSAMESASGNISLHGSSDALSAGGTVVPSSIKLPDNVFIVGTVNVDETTYMFSPKVLDRANVIEFRASADQMAAFLDNPAPINLDSLTAKGTGFASSFVNRTREDTTLVGIVDGENGEIATRLKNDLIEIFSPLAEVGAEFGFRTAKEIARFVAIHRELSGDDWNYVDALDAQVVQKLMPKLHGSARKLDAVLKALHKFASEKNLPLTKEKVERMQERLKRDGFTSFAEA